MKVMSHDQFHPLIKFKLYQYRVINCMVKLLCQLQESQSITMPLTDIQGINFLINTKQFAVYSSCSTSSVSIEVGILDKIIIKLFWWQSLSMYINFFNLYFTSTTIRMNREAWMHKLKLWTTAPSGVSPFASI